MIEIKKKTGPAHVTNVCDFFSVHLTFLAYTLNIQGEEREITSPQSFLTTFSTSFPFIFRTKALQVFLARSEKPEISKKTRYRKYWMKRSQKIRRNDIGNKANDLLLLFS